jgi:indole-3-glycerol phosphate synthase
MSWRPPQGVLAELVTAAREDCAGRQRARPGLANEVLRQRRTPLPFAAALADRSRGFPLICEVKRASPSLGAIRAVDAPAQARAYAQGGARCISVLTESRRFGGSLADLAAVREAVAVPLLRKDFVVDPYMIFEAAQAGADAVLLIVGALEPTVLAELYDCARELGLDALVEVVQPYELEFLDRAPSPLVGVNARDLETLAVDPGRFGRLAPQLAKEGRTLVAESGVKEPADIARFAQEGAGAALVGESLMRADDPIDAVRRLKEAA